MARTFEVGYDPMAVDNPANKKVTPNVTINMSQDYLNLAISPQASCMLESSPDNDYSIYERIYQAAQGKPIVTALQELSLATIGLNPQRFTINNSLPEDNAIVQVWPGCSIQHCIWHVMRAWMQNVQAKIHGSIGRTPKEEANTDVPESFNIMITQGQSSISPLASSSALSCYYLPY
ncbi:hypothetical protein BDC45DRAFT_572861 [Circinella umbellata]|nr:hypothetical protein BDC45DRAFT_572861 [Circinella umbellata]